MHVNLLSPSKMKLQHILNLANNFLFRLFKIKEEKEECSLDCNFYLFAYSSTADIESN